MGEKIPAVLQKFYVTLICLRETLKKKKVHFTPPKTSCRSSPEKLSGAWEYRGGVVTT